MSEVHYFRLIQFFNKMRKWSDMANLNQDFRDKVDRLERNFAVSTVIFKKFEPIFLDIFKDPATDTPRQQRSKKQRRLPCTVADVFNFSWTMFVQVKGNFPAISDDLVNSYHLLLCSVDWFFANAVLGGRKDLLKPDFAGLPDNFNSREWKPPSEAPCLVELLCQKHDGLVVEAKTIKEHWWKPHIKRLFEKKILKGKADTLSSILEIGNFEANVKAINSAYEEYVLSVGDFDERIFLGEDAEEEIGTPGGKTGVELSEQMQFKRSLKQHVEEPSDTHPGAHIDFARKRLQLGESLYFKSLESIVMGEKRRLQSSGKEQKVDLTGLLSHDLFHRSLFACCLEIVIFSYNSQRLFPWIVDMFDLAPYYFYKVVEIIIRAEEGLSRDVVKHLNHIEESILECHAWKSDSPIWEAIKEAGSVPTCEDILIPMNVCLQGPGGITNITATVTHSPKKSIKPKKTGSLALFFRKVYHLASVRLRELCDQLQVQDDDLRSKMWTCFEHSMTHCTELMCDRHLDQLLMCSVYIMAKVTEKPLNFQDIMKCYSQPPTPTRLGGAGGAFDFNPEERGDLIQFYNEDLRAINKMIRMGEAKLTGPIKRHLEVDADVDVESLESPSKQACVSGRPFMQRLRDVSLDRQEVQSLLS
nr:hypothetical protein BaRGS_012017 [Batillaria attramentaria]